jgi:hypothetical protein
MVPSRYHFAQALVSLSQSIRFPSGDVGGAVNRSLTISFVCDALSKFVIVTLWAGSNSDTKE